MTTKKASLNDIVVCRCMEITDHEIRDAVHHGADSFDAVKRVTRAGMGICQGRTCQHLVERLITQESEVPVAELPPLSVRPPLRPTKLDVIAKMKR
jgi:bacterioferritin-associated ferredoxin